jgi:hypothetical protein
VNHRSPHPAPADTVTGDATTGSSRFVCVLPGYPPMRMPHATGAILIHSCDLDPAGAVTAFTGTWHAHLAPTDTTDHQLPLQLFAPATDDPDHVDVRLWIARHRRWYPLGRWDAAGPEWPWLAAPVIAAATRPTATAPTPVRLHPVHAPAPTTAAGHRVPQHPRPTPSRP